MKIAAIVVLCVAVLAAVQVFAADETILKTDKDKVSYSLGLSLGTSMREQSVDVDPDLLLRGIKDGMTGTKALLTDDEVKAVIMGFQKQMAEKQKAVQEAAKAKNKTEGEAFLAANKSKEGVKTTASGLQYKVITEGKGPKPKDTDTVTVHYKGMLIDGTEFDSSYKRGEPATFPLHGVISGWSEGVQLMNVGSKYQFVIPPSLAYGDRGAGDTIGPDSTLVFEVELLSIKAPEAQTQTGPAKE
jgi:FKBP-type peptidyl-prolyl cis-trans isomerase FklB